MAEAGLVLMGGGGAFGPPLSPNRWYLPFNHGGLNTGAEPNQRMFAVPFQAGASTVLSGLAVAVTIVGNAASVCRLGIASDIAGMPGAVLYEGTVAGDAVAVPTLNPAIPVVAGTWYWQLYAAQNAAGTAPTIRLYQSGYTTRIGASAPGSASGDAGYYKDSVAGTFAAVGASWTPDGTNGILAPAIWLKGT